MPGETRNASVCGGDDCTIDHESVESAGPAPKHRGRRFLLSLISFLFLSASFRSSTVNVNFPVIAKNLFRKYFLSCFVTILFV